MSKGDHFNIEVGIKAILAVLLMQNLLTKREKEEDN